MSEKLRKYINEWYEMNSVKEKLPSDARLKRDELKSIQRAVRTVAEKEMDNLTEAEMMEVQKITSVNL